MKHPVPKKKKSRARSRRRYATFARITRKKLLDRLALKKCPSCAAPRLMHHACPACGSYRGKQTKNIAQAERKITKVKA